jgi:hypothetical protein
MMKDYVFWAAARVNVTLNGDILKIQVRSNDVACYTRQRLDGGGKLKYTVGLGCRSKKEGLKERSRSLLINVN